MDALRALGYPKVARTRRDSETRQMKPHGRKLPTHGLALLFAGLLFLSGCHGMWARSSPRVHSDLRDGPRIHRVSDGEWSPTSSDDVDVYFQKGFRLTLDGKRTKVPAWPTTIAEIEILRSGPDHADAVAELRRLAAGIGAEAITKVGYTIWEGKSYYGGVRIKGWVYHALAVRWEPRR